MLEIELLGVRYFQLKQLAKYILAGAMIAESSIDKGKFQLEIIYLMQRQGFKYGIVPNACLILCFCGLEVLLFEFLTSDRKACVEQVLVYLVVVFFAIFIRVSSTPMI